MITIICFSKNRPFQLKEYLRTLKKYAQGKYKTYVIYTCDDEYATAYMDLHVRCKDATFIRESKNLLDDIEKIINESGDSYLMFNSDDALFQGKIDFEGAVRSLSDEAVAFHSFRLHPGINYCHPAQRQCYPPSLEETPEGYKFYYPDGTVDWNYPFELGSTVYRASDILNLFTQFKRLFPKNVKITPNSLEAFCSQIYHIAKGWQRPFGVCSKNRVCSFITINRVQDDFQNPIYDEVDTLALLQHYWDNKELDDERYACKEYNACHIGDFILK